MKLKTILIVIAAMILAFAVIHALISLIYAFYIGCFAGIVVLILFAYWWLKKNL